MSYDIYDNILVISQLFMDGITLLLALIYFLLTQTFSYLDNLWVIFGQPMSEPTPTLGIYILGYAMVYSHTL